MFGQLLVMQWLKWVRGAWHLIEIFLSSSSATIVFIHGGRPCPVVVAAVPDRQSGVRPRRPLKHAASAVRTTSALGQLLPAAGLQLLQANSTQAGPACSLSSINRGHCRGRRTDVVVQAPAQRAVGNARGAPFCDD